MFELVLSFLRGKKWVILSILWWSTSLHLNLFFPHGNLVGSSRWLELKLHEMNVTHSSIRCMCDGFSLMALEWVWVKMLDGLGCQARQEHGGVSHSTCSSLSRSFYLGRGEGGRLDTAERRKDDKREVGAIKEENEKDAKAAKKC